LIDKWKLGSLGRRAAAATSIAGALRESQPRTDTVPFIRVPYTVLMPAHPEWETAAVSGHQDGLELFAQHLQSQMDAVNLQAANTAQRITQLADKVRTGILGIPAALA
jgi:hypothetical protein